ncbi:hypothetical protein [Halovivax cerinus]|uniref:DUF1102 domain-containing protein n=1 Tax=Halovivax cerinus TaxID=1487865 RepID=A0ABD5NL75_9EURY|nr:hypothetical protein [Halovivax cerinus]
MRMNRRNVLVGLGGIVASGGALLGTGAFSTVEAQRTVTVDTAGDASALIALNEGSSSMVTTDGDGLLQIDLSGSNWNDASGVNSDATITITDAFTVENNSDDPVDISFSDDGSDVGLTLTPSTASLQASASDDSDQQSFDLEVDTSGAATDATFDVTLTITATNTA